MRFLPAVPILTLVALLAGPASSLHAAERLPIVDRSIEHHGGDVYRDSHTTLRLCSGSGCYAVSARLRGDLYEYEVEGPYRGGTRQVRSTNESVEAWADGKPLAVEGEAERQRLRDWAMARVYFCFLPFRLNDASVSKEDQGLESWNGRDLRRVKVTFAAGSSTDAEDEYLYWLDPETARLEQLAYSFQGRPGGLRFRRLSNYRRVGGLLFFDQENLGVGGDGLRVDQITPAFVAERFRPISQVTLEAIQVERSPS